MRSPFLRGPCPPAVFLAAAVLMGGTPAQEPAGAPPSITLPGADEAPGASAGPAVVVRLEGELDATWVHLLRRADAAAREQGADFLIVELDTPGGEMELMRRLGEVLDAAGEGPLTTVAWIRDRAWSAGAWLAVGCEEIWMTPDASMGSATVVLGPAPMPGLEDLEELREKYNSAFRAEFRAWAEKHGRHPAIAEAFVDDQVEVYEVYVDGELRIVTGRELDDLQQSGRVREVLRTLCKAGELLNLTALQARELGYCEGIADSEEELLAGLGAPGAPVVRIETTWSEDLVLTLGAWSWLLLLGIAFSLVVAWNMPGLGGPEILAVVLLALFLGRNWLVGLAEWTEILLVLLGLVLLGVELFLLPGTLVAGAAGILSLGAGLLLAMQDFVLPGDPVQWDTLRSNLLLLFGLAILGPAISMVFVRRFTRTRLGSRLTAEPPPGFAGSVAGPALEGSGPPGALAGYRGRALTPLRPAGRVEVEGQPYDARSTGAFLEPGTPVEVVGVRGTGLLVRPAQEPAGSDP